jgi:hypothetical protein
VKLRLSAEHADFLADSGLLAGRYIFVNEFKPAFRDITEHGDVVGFEEALLWAAQDRAHD